jgi:hypothetical protein
VMHEAVILSDGSIESTRTTPKPSPTPKKQSDE